VEAQHAPGVEPERERREGMLQRFQVASLHGQPVRLPLVPGGVPRRPAPHRRTRTLGGARLAQRHPGDVSGVHEYGDEDGEQGVHEQLEKRRVPFAQGGEPVAQRLPPSPQEPQRRRRLHPGVLPLGEDRVEHLPQRIRRRCLHAGGGRQPDYAG
jgi:hypothetical protein